ncbi:hypothetical protein KY342_05320 [Candidatus Woesearchaeota archaeon]|nr:hypothetical protein [Candidatus Woesearchaeota archaeon]
MALFLVLCVSMVSAAVSLQGTYDEDDPNFGGPEQDASNPKSDDDDEHDIYINSVNLVLTSNETVSVDVTGVSFTYTYGFSTSDLNLSVSGSLPTGITNTAPGTLVLNGRVPEDLDAVETDDSEDDYLMPKAFHVADAVVTFSDLSTLTIPVYIQRENKLVFKSDRIYLSINEGSEDRIKDNEDSEEIRPGDDITIKVVAENEYSSSDNVEIEDVTANVLLDSDTDSSWDWEDIDEDIDLGSVPEGDEEEESVDFSVDDEVDNYGTYDMYVYLTGTDENDAEHGEKIKINFDVRRKKYDFILTKAELGSSILSCSRATSLNVRAESIGYRGDDEISVYVKNTVLGIDLYKTGIELEKFGEDDVFSQTFQIDIPEDAAAANYALRVVLYYSGTDNDGVHADEKDVTLTVRDCATNPPTNNEEEAEEEEEETTIEDTTETQIPNYILDEFGITESVETSFTNSTAYIVLLAVAIVAAISTIGLLVFLVLKR